MGFTLARPLLVSLPSSAHGRHLLGPRVDGKRIQSHPCRFLNGKKRGSIAGTEDGVSGCEGCVIRGPWCLFFFSMGFLLGQMGVEQTE